MYNRASDGLTRASNNMKDWDRPFYFLSNAGVATETIRRLLSVCFIYQKSGIVTTSTDLLMVDWFCKVVTEK